MGTPSPPSYLKNFRDNPRAIFYTLIVDALEAQNHLTVLRKDDPEKILKKTFQTLHQVPLAPLISFWVLALLT